MRPSPIVASCSNNEQPSRDSHHLSHGSLIQLELWVQAEAEHAKPKAVSLFGDAVFSSAYAFLPQQPFRAPQDTGLCMWPTRSGYGLLGQVGSQTLFKLALPVGTQPRHGWLSPSTEQPQGVRVRVLPRQ